MSMHKRPTRDEMDRDQLQILLDRAKSAQADYWMAMADLEVELGVDLDDSLDMSDWTVDGMLDNAFAGVDDAACTCDERSWHGEQHDHACPLAGWDR